MYKNYVEKKIAKIMIESSLTKVTKSQISLKYGNENQLIIVLFVLLGFLY